MSRNKLLALAVTLMVTILLFAGCVAALKWALSPAHQASVPNDAKPRGFDKLISWTECGATGDYCAESIIFGGREGSFRDAVAPIAEIYREKGWEAPSEQYIDALIRLIDPGRDTCITLSELDSASPWRKGLFAPEPATIAAVIEPYSVIIEVDATTCA